MTAVKGVVAVALLVLPLLCRCGAVPQGYDAVPDGRYAGGQAPFAASQYSAGDVNPETGNRFAARPVSEPGAYGYESEIPGARASFKAYREDPQYGASGLYNNYDAQAFQSQGRPY